MKTLLLDCDGVIVNSADPVHHAAEGILARPLPPPTEWQDHRFPEAMDMSQVETEFFNKSMLFDDSVGWKCDLYPGAEEVVHELSKHYDVCFVTAQWPMMKHWCVARENLLKSYFPDIDIVFTHAKWRVSGDILVDDSADNVMMVGGAKGVLFDRPWNRGFRTERRATGYEHLLQMLELV